MKAFGGNGFVDIYRILKDYMSIDYALMLRFCLANANVSTIDAGAKYADEFRADIEAAREGPLGSAEIARLKQEADRLAPHMKDICRECMHCQEKFACPEGIDFAGILAAYSRFLVGSRAGYGTEGIREIYQAFEKNAEDCIECAECVPWCEYKLNIPEMLKEAHQALA
jgi:predicted aldo/keto reductase-like oxidoreductase